MSTESAKLSSIDANVIEINGKIDAVIASNATLTADAVAKDQLIATLQTDLATAQANAVDPADAALIDKIAQDLADGLAKLP